MRDGKNTVQTYRIDESSDIRHKPHRVLTDGDGITTLVAFYGCPLDCRYCVNPQCKHAPRPEDYYTPESLLEAVAADNLYYRATNGGITFGGGEPALQSRFIEEFRRICPPEWRITLETSLNVPREHIERLLPVVDSWIVDIKDCNDAIYTTYTGKSNAQAMENLNCLLASKNAYRIAVRVPYIAGYNARDDVEKSVAELRRMGVLSVERFAYRTKELSEPEDEIAAGAVGKRICEQLKAVRMRVAMAAGIKYRPQDCPHRVCATGSCPACEAETAELSQEVFDDRNDVCVDGIVSRRYLTENYHFVFCDENDGGSLFGAASDSGDETRESLRPLQPDNPQECSAEASVSFDSFADSDASASCEDECDTALEWLRTLPTRWLGGAAPLPPGQEGDDEDDPVF